MKDLTNKYIQVALITINIPGRGHFYSPYKFQVHNEDLNVPDENPTYISVDTDRDSKYEMR